MEKHENSSDSLINLTVSNNPPKQKIQSDIIISDYIQPKYEREIKSDLIVKYLTFLVIGIDILIFFGTIKKTLYNFNNLFYIFYFICFIIFFLLDIAWLHYKLQHIIFGGYKLFMDMSVFKTNSKYYSGLEIPDSFLNNRYFPDITIQLPVYKEDLENTIKPTIMSAIEQANRYMLETSSMCNIIVCDDGLNLISENDKQERIKFYTSQKIGYTARPHTSKLKRRGRFKKAGNLNFSMNYANIAYSKINNYNENNIDISETTDENYPDLLMVEFDNMLALGAGFDGNLLYGSYIFLIDSDTRLPDFPLMENGCLKRMVKDIMFDGENSVLYIQCFTGPYLSTKSLSEKCVFNFTCHIYNGILVSTSLNIMAPLVGHNALLNVKLLHDIAHVNPETKFKYFWDEDRISEDFDCMMRGCEKGYIGRYLTSSGIFLEGVSFNYMTEYFKVSKFACGAAELTFNPVSLWFKKGGGFFSPDIIGFIFCKEIEWYNKISILAYILNFIAIAQAHLAMFYNLIFFQQLAGVLPFVLLPVNLMWEGMIVWGVINTIINVSFSKRVHFDTKIVLVQQIRELFFTSALYGSLSVRFSIMYITHLFNLTISFGSTQKNDETVTIIDWIKSTKYECGVYTFYVICIIIRLFRFPVVSLWYTFYFGCLPLFMNIFWYWFGPIVYDILPTKKDKTGSTCYDKDTKMFADKYHTQIPNSIIFNKNNKNIICTQ
jgi:hypothetical protein